MSKKLVCTNQKCLLRTYEKGLYCSDNDKRRCRDYKNEQLTIEF